jgi:hypothetical protein
MMHIYDEILDLPKGAPYASEKTPRMGSNLKTNRRALLTVALACALVPEGVRDLFRGVEQRC